MLLDHQHFPDPDLHCRTCGQPLIELSQNHWVSMDEFEAIQIEDVKAAREEEADRWYEPCPPRE